ncbi:MAG: molybdopterin-guanine dinucleotide biosynthesis protein B [Desulfobulbaceae bacterium A2]|nr:MAG: molybdopterin-guanine dinucleotide biosynthesis protein B [Desulfobulbaceae bacterium A2]
MPTVISCIGRPDSGKTTLLEKLLPELVRRGLRVGVIKHHVHAFSMDIPGKDTHRLKQAGAAVVALAAPDGLGVIRDTNGRDPDPAELLRRYFDDCDLVLTEGYKQHDFPKLEIVRFTRHEGPLPAEAYHGPLLARASDQPDRLPPSPPVFPLDDPAPLADFLTTLTRTDRQDGSA